MTRADLITAYQKVPHKNACTERGCFAVDYDALCDIAWPVVEAAERSVNAMDAEDSLPGLETLMSALAALRARVDWK